MIPFEKVNNELLNLGVDDWVDLGGGRCSHWYITLGGIREIRDMKDKPLWDQAPAAFDIVDPS
jgi:hypothetical protein